MKNTKTALIMIATLLIVALSSTAMAGDRHRHDSARYDNDRHYDQNYDRNHDRKHDRGYDGRRDRGHHQHHPGKHGKFGKVVYVRPIYKTFRVAVPEQQCYQREYRKPIKRHVHRHNGGEVIVGGVIGGIIGHELGRNHNQGLATVTGALIGSAIAHDAGTKHYSTGDYRVEHRRHCRTEIRYETERQLIGYRVKYRYKGDIYVTRMDHHPGKRIRIDGHSHRHGKRL